MKILSTQSVNHRDNVASSDEKQDFQSTLISQKYRRRKYITKSLKKSKKRESNEKNKIISSREQSLKQRYHECRSSQCLQMKEQSKTRAGQIGSGTEISKVEGAGLGTQFIELADKVYQYCGQIQISIFERQTKYIPQPLKDQSEISIFNREQLAQWVFSVNEKFNFKQNTGFLSINILDRVLGLIDIQIHQLHLLAITCIFLAAKYEQMSIPKISDFVYLGRGNQHVSKNNILKLQAIILLNIEFDLSYVSPTIFIDLLGLKYNFSEETKKKLMNTIKNFMMKIEYRCWKPSKLVESAFHQLFHSLE